MRTRLLKDEADGKTHIIVFDEGEEVAGGIEDFARLHGLGGASIVAIGAFKEVTLGFFELDRKDYLRIEIAEQIEVLSLIGNLAWSEGRAKLHAHAVVGKRDGTAHGGHLLRGIVRPTLEVIVRELRHLERRFDPVTGLPLLVP
jgi:predicted DNA-binding protein with PD1-like motif